MEIDFQAVSYGLMVIGAVMALFEDRSVLGQCLGVVLILVGVATHPAAPWQPKDCSCVDVR